MARCALRAGRSRATPIFWENICGDVRAVILGKLSFPELARAATTCRELHNALQGKIPHEQARLIAAGEDSFGKELFSFLVGALDRTARGLPGIPGFLREDGGSRIMGAMLRNIVDIGVQPDFVAVDIDYLMLSCFYCPWPCGVVFNPVSAKTSANKMFSAQLRHRETPGRPLRHGGNLTNASLEIVKTSPLDGGLRLTAQLTEAGLSPVMGLILAMCLANPAGFSARPSPLRVDLRVRGRPGARGAREKQRS